jgi:hypothetical protein
VRYRLGSVVAAVALLVNTVGIQSAAAAGPTLTRLRVELWGTSDWQEIEFSGAFVGAHHVEALTPGAELERGWGAFVLHGPGNQTVSATFSVLLEVYDWNSFPIKLTKGKIGHAHTTLHRINNADTTILSMNNYETSGDKEVSSSLDRSQLVGTGYLMPKVDNRRLVLAFYYPWWQAGTFNSGPWYDKPVGPYNTDDPGDVAAMTAQAKDAGVDGFIVSWDDVGDHSERFDLALSEAADQGMYAVPLIEMLMFQSDDGSFNAPAIIATMKKALQRSTNPGYLYVGARPVLFVYGAYQMGLETWRSIDDALAAAGHNPFFVGEPISSTFGLDGSYLYNPNGYTHSGLTNKYRANTRSLRYAAQVDPLTPQRLWAATVSPGQNLSYAKPMFPDHVDRKKGERYAMSWSVATCSDPEWVLITSWNEWFEATHIAPSERFGYKALNQTRTLSAGFHDGSSCSGSGGGGGGVLPPINLPIKLPAGQQ